MVAAAYKPSSLEWFFDTLLGQFNANNLGEVSKILGVQATRDKKKRAIYLEQEQYISGVLDQFGITNEKRKPEAIPVADREHLQPSTKEDEQINSSEYLQAIGSLMYAMILTRQTFYLH